MQSFSGPAKRPVVRILFGTLASAALLGLYARGGLGWLLGFIALVPWLCALNIHRTVVSALLGSYLMTVAFTGGAFAWFGAAIGGYTQVGEATGLAVLLVLAPLFQPQIIGFALVRHVSRKRFGWLLSALTGAAAWVATERLLPKLLGDTLGHGLYPSALLRQAADLGGAAGLTVLLLLANEAIAAAIARRSAGWRAMAKPLALAALIPLVLAGYGFASLPSATPVAVPQADKPLRIGLVQTNLVDYERMRQEMGVSAAVREILDTHYAMSYDAVERQRVDAVLWSETAYPTTFAHPKSQAGADLDTEILGIMQSAGVPFVFGTYDRDAAGEYNAAAFVAPGAGLLGFYRKSRPFPLTETVPAWLDSSTLRKWLPWTGNWLAGDGARVFPLRLANGREIPVLPMICLDDVDSGLAIEGARLGARAILTLSNDSWFTSQPLGAQLHQAVAAFRSIETRLPQFRVTTNGYSAAIDTRGAVIASAPMGSRTLVIGELPVPTPPRTLMVMWGNWVGLAGAAFLLLVAVFTLFSSLPGRGAEDAAQDAMVFPVPVAVLPPGLRIAAGLLRSFARAGLLWMGVALVLDDSLRSNTLAQIRTFTGLFLIPEAAAWFLLQAFGARAWLEDGRLVIARGTRRLELATQDIAAVELWRLPIPGPGLSLRLVSGGRWGYGLVIANPNALARALAGAGVAPVQVAAASRTLAYRQAYTAVRRSYFDQAWMKFGVLPLAMALVAFRLHQHIAYGSTFGEYYSYGLQAYLTTLALWWAAWTIGVVLCAAALRTAIEIAALLVALLSPTHALAGRYWLERLGLALLFMGLPGWLLLQVLQR